MGDGGGGTGSNKWSEGKQGDGGGGAGAVFPITPFISKPSPFIRLDESAAAASLKADLRATM